MNISFRTSKPLLVASFAAFLAVGCTNQRADDQLQHREQTVQQDLGGAQGPKTTTVRQAYLATSMAEARATHAMREVAGGWESAEAAEIKARIDADGLKIQSSPESSVFGAIHLTRVGRELGALPKPVITNHENRVDLHYGAVDEWYQQGPLGIEHGLTLFEKPNGDGAITVELSLDHLSARVEQNTVWLREDNGVERYTLSDLVVIDSRGEEIPSTFEAHGNQIRYIIDDKYAQYPIYVDPILQTSQTIEDPNATASDEFGTSVAIAGNYAVVGAPQAATCGKAYVYNFSNSSWTLFQTITPSTCASGDKFGTSVGIDTNVVAVGAPGVDKDVSTPDVGKVYAYRRTGGAGQFTGEKVLTQYAPASNEEFGTSVSVSGDRIAVGAPHEGYFGCTDCGGAYVFTWNVGNSSWGRYRFFQADTIGGDNLGQAVAINSTTVLIGASQATVSGLSNSGAAYVFTYNGSSWAQQAKLSPSTPSASTNFGASVALLGDIAVVGAPTAIAGGKSNAGLAYLFNRSGTTWSQGSILSASDADVNALFGISVSISSFLIAIGSPRRAVGNTSYAGKVYIHAKHAGQWAEQAILTAPTAQTNAQFGISAAVSGNGAVVGAYIAQNGSSVQTGRAYTFQLSWVGESCSLNSECNTGYCVDGVCCNTQCGTGNAADDAADCQACSIAAGGQSDGVCSTISAAKNHVCRPAAPNCDVEEICNGVSVDCPTDTKATSGDCDDGNACTIGDTCNPSGECAPISEKSCPSLPCQPSTCNPGTGECEVQVLPDDTVCNDNNVCTTETRCVAGECTNVVGMLDCSTMNECSMGTCDQIMGCGQEALPEGTPCTDGMCHNGLCMTGSGGTAGTAGSAGATGGSGGSAAVGGTGGSGGSGAATGGGAGTSGMGAGGAGGSGDGGSSAGAAGSAGNGGESGNAQAGSNTGATAGTTGNSGANGGSGGNVTVLPPNSASEQDGGCSMNSKGPSREESMFFVLIAAGGLVARRRKETAA